MGRVERGVRHGRTRHRRKLTNCRRHCATDGDAGTLAAHCIERGAWDHESTKYRPPKSVIKDREETARPLKADLPNGAGPKPAMRCYEDNCPNPTNQTRNPTQRTKRNDRLGNSRRRTRLTDKVNRPDCQPNDEGGTDRRKHDGRLADCGSWVGLNVGLGMDELDIEES